MDHSSLAIIITFYLVGYLMFCSPPLQYESKDAKDQMSLPKRICLSLFWPLLILILLLNICYSIITNIILNYQRRRSGFREEQVIKLRNKYNGLRILQVLMSLANDEWSIELNEYMNGVYISKKVLEKREKTVSYVVFIKGTCAALKDINFHGKTVKQLSMCASCHYTQLWSLTFQEVWVQFFETDGDGREERRIIGTFPNSLEKLFISKLEKHGYNSLNLMEDSSGSFMALPRKS